MENNNTQLTTTGGQVPAFVQEKLNSLAGAMEYANTLLKSGIAPAHFYHKGGDGKPDFNKGKPEAVVIVLQFGSEIGMTPMQALQQLIPVNNLVSLKGDGAKALIQRSGKLATWQETEIGTQGKDDWGFKIEATRKDTGERNITTFTVADAKRAGLWIDDSLLQRFPNMKHSPWYKHPRRMLKYRALGFISRDLFPDVLSGIYTEEEAIDIQNDVTTQVVEGVTVDLNKEATTEKGNDQVVQVVEAKKTRAKTLAGATTEKVVIVPAAEEKQPEPVIEPEPIASTNDAFAPSADGGVDVEAYEKMLKSLSPQDLGKEFRAKNAAGLLPFSVDTWLKMGGSKLPKDLILVMVAAMKSKEELAKALKTLGLTMPEPVKEARSLEKQLEIMDMIEQGGYDADILAVNLKYPNKEEMLAFAAEEDIKALLA